MKVKPAQRYLPPTTAKGWSIHVARSAGRGIWALALNITRSPFWPWLWALACERAKDMNQRSKK